jgi:hypothetical protein
MSREEDRIRFLLTSARLQIAEVCREEWLTRYEIARVLGRKAGSLSQPETMAEHGALKRQRRRKGSDGRESMAYRLSSAWKPALEQALERSSPAWPSAGQDLFLIPLNEVERAGALLEEGVPGVAWAARVTGGPGGLGGLILAPSQDEDGSGTLRVVTALRETVRGLERLHVEQVLTAADLRTWAARIGGRGGELPAP